MSILRFISKLILPLLILLVVCSGLSTALADAISTGFQQREKYRDATRLGNPLAAKKFIDRNADVSNLGELNDAGLIDQGRDSLRNGEFGKFLQDSDEAKIEAMNRYKINSENAMLKNSLKVEEDPMSKIGGKGLSATETITATEVKKSCTEGVDFNVDVGLELVLEVAEEEDSLKRDATINLEGVDILNRFGNWGHYVRKRYGVRLWVLHPASPEKEKQARELIAEKLGVSVSEIGEKVRFPANGFGTIGWDSEGNVSINPYEDTFVFPEYEFGYQKMEKLKRFVEKDEYWQVATQGAEQLADSNECYETGRVCIKSGVKTFFGKYDVSRPCWYEKITYKCTSEPKDGCAHLEKQDCRLQESECEYKVGSICLRWKRDYICGGEKKELKFSLADSPIYCLGGDCHTPTLEGNPDFANVGYLAALNEANKDCVKENTGICKNPITVFAGQAEACDKAIVGFINCCSSMKGWGNDINLSRCSPVEKGLALKRDKGLCHRVGTYCSKRDPALKTCLIKKTNFCCFGSKLARIFQEQGRTQLGISWGSAEAPNCRPLTLTELTSLDFSKFDMEELFDALLSKGKRNMSKSFPNLSPGEIPAIQKEHMQTSSGEKRDIRRKAEEEAERKRLAKLEAERLEKENLEKIRLAEIENERLATLEAARKKELARITAERQEANRLAQIEFERTQELTRRRNVKATAVNSCMQEYRQAVAIFNRFSTGKGLRDRNWMAEQHRLHAVQSELFKKCKRLEQELNAGQY